MGKEAYFDMRAIGAVCTALWLACVWGMLRLLRRAPVMVRITAAAASLAVLTDVLYVAYFQSFYADCAAMIFLFSTCLLDWRAAQTHSTSWILSFAASAILLILWKLPYIMLVPWLFIFAVFLWWRSRSVAWMLTAALPMIPVGITVSSLPVNYIKPGTFNVIFTRLVPTAKDPVAVLAEFGFPPEAVQNSGEYVYTATTPFNDERWRARNAGSLTSQRLIAFYARHPVWMVYNLWEDLERNASRMRFRGNYRREDGQPPDRIAPSRLGWSNLRSFLLRKMRWRMPLFYLAILIGGASWALRGPSPGRRSAADFVSPLRECP